MAMTISCKFEKASYNIFFVRAVTVKSLYTVLMYLQIQLMDLYDNVSSLKF